jgi:hypothetical protein
MQSRRGSKYGTGNAVSDGNLLLLMILAMTVAGIAGGVLTVNAVERWIDERKERRVQGHNL